MTDTTSGLRFERPVSPGRDGRGMIDTPEDLIADVELLCRRSIDPEGSTATVLNNFAVNDLSRADVEKLAKVASASGYIVDPDMDCDERRVRQRLLTAEQRRRSSGVLLRKRPTPPGPQYIQNPRDLRRGCWITPARLIEEVEAAAMRGCGQYYEIYHQRILESLLYWLERLDHDEDRQPLIEAATRRGYGLDPASLVAASREYRDTLDEIHEAQE